MEVDEAANHIRELVDPDANIIWGSAFNDSLEGKIRVSVVATGIDHDGAASEDNARPFSFARNSAPTSAATAAAPVATSQEPAAADVQPETEAMESHDSVEEDNQMPLVTPSGDDSFTDEAATPLDLGLADETEHEETPSGSVDEATYSGSDDADASDDEDELLLDSTTMETAENNTPPVLEAPDADEADGLLSKKPAPRIASGGGTLFERMASLSRSERKDVDADEDKNEDDGPLNIPRFLNRQNNQ